MRYGRVTGERTQYAPGTFAWTDLATPEPDAVKEEAALAKIKELGGNAIAGPFEMAMAKIAIAQDPPGAVFALYAGELQP